MSLESLNIDVYCLSETRIQDSGEVLQIRSPSVASKSFFYVRLSGDPVASSSGLSGVVVALSARAEAALIDWIPINNRLCAVRLESSIKVRKNRREKRCLFFSSPPMPRQIAARMQSRMNSTTTYSHASIVLQHGPKSRAAWSADMDVRLKSRP
ncbi:unnamed protein product [Schistosoma mattheei]|uniref:Uncharacterized protein n=1 Tax=Schistosoma mattheei TaxID=31246 RepID=A0A183Q5E3_9TREM|nr:unnamed protein product [Schistosoma mattheei]